MLKKKALLKRIKSLEEYLGIKYSPGDGGEYDNEHFTDDYGRMKHFDEMRKEHNKNNQPK